MTITLNGDTGITTPGLTNTGSTTIVALTTTGNTILGDASTDTLNVGNGNLVTDASGNVGVGVTPSAWRNTFKALQILGTATLSSNANTAVYLGSNWYTNSAGQDIYIANGAASIYSISSGIHSWLTAPSGTAGNAITFTQAMTLDASANLLVGVTSNTNANNRLYVVGPLASYTSSATTLATSATSASVRLSFAKDSSQSIFMGMATDGTNYPSYLQAANGDGTTASNLTLQPFGGNLLVGATSTSGNVVQIYNNSNQAGRININKTTTGLFNALVFTYSGTTVGSIDYSNTGTAFNTSSDIRMKKDIVDAGSASTKIDQIRIVSHGWKHDDAVVEFGVIAQELFNVAPQAVSAGDDGEEIETTWGVDYSKLVPLLIKAHQEQQAIITTLTARITALESA